MKKVFQIKLKNITRVFALVVAASLVTFTGCKSYDNDITGLQGQIDKVVTDVAGLKTSVAALQTSVSGMAYIKSITMDAAGKLTITPSTGANIVYDAKNYVTYDITLTGNNLMVNGVNKGTVVLPALTFKDGQLLSGTTVVADLAKAMTLGADNFLYVGGVKTSVAIPAATVPSVDVKSITSVTVGNVTTLTITKNDGSVSNVTIPAQSFIQSVDVKSITAATVANVTTLTITMNDNSVKQVTIPAEAITLASSYNATTGEVTLTVNGVTTKVIINNTYTVTGGFLYVNGVKTTVAIPAENKTTVLYSKNTVSGVIQTLTVTDATGTTTVKVNPSNELLSSILFVPEWINGGVNAVELGYVVDTTRVYNAAGAVTNLTYGSGDKKASFTQSKVIFRLNPTSADITNTTWSFLNNLAVVNAPSISNAPGDASTLFAAPAVTALGDGSVSLPLQVATWVEPAAGKTHLFALQAKGKDFYSGAESNVVSDYVKVVVAQYNAFITDAKLYAGTPKVVTDYTQSQPIWSSIDNHTIVYNAATKTNLNNLVLATAENTPTLSVPTITRKLFADYKLGTLGVDYMFTFENIKTIGADGITDQAAFIKIEANGDITVLNGTASIDRTPVVKVTLKNAAGKVLSFGYIKIKISTSSTDAFTYTLSGGSYNYNTLFKGNAVIASNLTPIELTWTKLNTDVLPVLGLSNTQFQTLYSTATTVATGKFNGVTMNAADLAAIATPLVWTTSGTPGVDSYVVKYNVTPLAKFGTYSLVYVITPTSGAPLSLNYTFTVVKPVLNKIILPGYQYNSLPTDVLTQGTNYGSGYAMQLYLGEGFGYGSYPSGATNMRGMFAATTANKIDFATHQLTFKVGAKGSYQTGAAVNSVSIPTTANATVAPTPYPAALLPNSTNSVSLDAAIGFVTGGQTGTLMALTTPLTTAERVYDMNFYTYYPNAEKDSTGFKVHFQNPISIATISPLNPGFTLSDVITGQVDTLDVAPNYNVMFGNKIAIKGGVLQTLNTTTTVNAADFGITAGSLTYALSTTGYSYLGVSLAGTYGTPPVTYLPSVLKWINNGTSIGQTVPVAKVTPTVTTTYATAKRDDEISVKSSSAPGFVKGKK